jgi:hypothetical protein
LVWLDTVNGSEWICLLGGWYVCECLVYLQHGFKRKRVCLGPSLDADEGVAMACERAFDL